MSFDQLNLKTSLRNALDDLGIQQPTPIQEKVFSIGLSGQDVVGIAQTGTGKTFAYLLPCLCHWKFTKGAKHPQILVVVPTRELVIQVVEAVEQLTSFMNVVVKGAYGGANLRTQGHELKESGMDVLVATPGRLMDLHVNSYVKLKTVKHLVVDEVDEMLNLGFRHQLSSIFEILPEKRQNLAFSATMTEEVEELIESYFKSPQKVEAAPSGTPVDQIEQRIYSLPNFNTKVNFLKKLLREDKEMSKVLVFAANKKMADLLHSRLEEFFGEELAIVHSNKSQNYRFEAVRSFSSGEARVLIATDLVARGLDISGVSHVVNFDLPEQPESYIHRIGRTGRADEKGVALTLVGEKEAAEWKAIEELMKTSLAFDELPEDLELSTRLEEFEQEKVHMKHVFIKPQKREDAGEAFHEKKAKNQKVNKKLRRAEELKLKYKKPKTRGQKRKK